MEKKVKMNGCSPVHYYSKRIYKSGSYAYLLDAVLALLCKFCWKQNECSTLGRMNITQSQKKKKNPWVTQMYKSIQFDTDCSKTCSSSPIGEHNKQRNETTIIIHTQRNNIKCNLTWWWKFWYVKLLFKQTKTKK